MKKNSKKNNILALAFSAALCASAAFGVNAMSTTTASADGLADNFSVVGMAIRFVDAGENGQVANGIRFGVGVKADTYAALEQEENLEELDKLKLLVMPSVLVDGDLEVDETYEANDIIATAKDCELGSKWTAMQKDGVDYMVAWAYLYDIDASYYDLDLTARAYYLENEDAEPVYSAAIERSYITVADACLEELADEQSEAFPNAVGSSYSPYTAAQRDALLGVTYKKGGTWDLVDGNLVGLSRRTQADTNEHAMLVDRNFQADDEYVVSFSFKTPAIDPSWTGATANKEYENAVKGVALNYDEATDAYMLFDIRYRYLAGENSTSYIPAFRCYNGNGSWGAYAGTDGRLAPETWYDFSIYVDKDQAAGSTRLVVDYKLSSDSSYERIMDQSVAHVYGNGIGFYNTAQDFAMTFNPTIGYNNEYFVTKGTATQNQDGSVTLNANKSLGGANAKLLNQSLNADGTGIIQGSFNYVYRKTGSNTEREGIKFSGTSGNGYFFWISEQAGNNRFYVGLWKNQNTNGTANWNNTGMSNGAAVPAYPTDGSLTVGDEIIVSYKITITIVSGVKNFTTEFTLTSGSWSVSQTWSSRDDGTMFTGGDVYLETEDVGTIGDGKTTYFETTVTK